MGFYDYASPYDWSRVSQYKAIARGTADGMVDLSIGSPVDPVPQSVQRALADAANAPNAYGYPATIGTPELRQAIATWFREARDVELNAIHADLVPTVGSKEAVALMASLLQLGTDDCVVQPAVSYPTYEIGTQVAGAHVVKVADVADTESWVHIPNVKAVWVNSPCNPTGAVYSAAQMHDIVVAARSIGAVVLSDECYAMMVWNADNDDEDNCESSLESSPCALRADICEGDASNILVLYSLSKQSNMAGYRAACLAGDATIIRRMSDMRKQLGLIMPGPIQAAMVAGLRDEHAVREQHNRYARRLTMLVEALRNYGYDAHMPQGGLYIWVRALQGDCWADMADLATHGIVPSPGEFYGAPDYLRFSATVSDDAIARAIAQLSE